MQPLGENHVSVLALFQESNQIHSETTKTLANSISFIFRVLKQRGKMKKKENIKHEQTSSPWQQQ